MTVALALQAPAITLREPLRGLRMLVADDEEPLRLGLVDFLSEKGAEVRAAADGYEAVRRGYEERFDMVLVAFRMPGIDGLGVLRSFRILSPRPVSILMTGYPDGGIYREAEAVEVDLILRKPLLLNPLPYVINGLKPCRRFPNPTETGSAEQPGQRKNADAQGIAQQGRQAHDAEALHEVQSLRFHGLHGDAETRRDLFCAKP